MVSGSLIHSVDAIQVSRQTSPEAMDLSRPQRHEVLVPSQSPKIFSYKKWNIFHYAHLFSVQGLPLCLYARVVLASLIYILAHIIYNIARWNA